MRSAPVSFDLPPLRSMVLHAGIEERRNEVYRWDGMKRSGLPTGILQYTLAGEGRLRRGGRTWRLEPGDAMLLHTPDAHVYELPPGGSWRFFFVAGVGEEFLRLWRWATEVTGPVLRLKHGHPLLEIAARISLDLLTAQDRSSRHYSALSYELAMRLVETADGLRAPGTLPPAIREALAVIERHYAGPLSVEDLAGRSGLSRAHFTRTFSKCMGITPVECLIQQRLRAAVDLLEGSSASSKSIAAACGFRDPNYFCRVFRERLGQSPQAFRLARLAHRGS